MHGLRLTGPRGCTKGQDNSGYCAGDNAALCKHSQRKSCTADGVRIGCYLGMDTYRINWNCTSMPNRNIPLLHLLRARPSPPVPLSASRAQGEWSQIQRHDARVRRDASSALPVPECHKDSNPTSKFGASRQVLARTRPVPPGQPWRIRAYPHAHLPVHASVNTYARKPCTRTTSRHTFHTYSSSQVPLAPSVDHVHQPSTHPK